MNRALASSVWEEELARVVETYPAPSSAAWDLYRRFSSDDSDLMAALEVASRDPVFTAQVIRHARSAEFGSREVASLNDAVVAIGFSRLRRLALAFAFRSLSSGQLPTYDLTAQQFYRKSVACAAAMDFLYPEQSDGPGEMYTLGLLHAIGEIFIDAAVRNLVEDPLRIVGPTPQKVAAIEQSLLGANQAKIAGRILRRWRFPDSIVIPIEQQFLASSRSPFFEVTQSLSVARYVAQKTLQGIGVGAQGKSYVVVRRRLLSEVYEYAAMHAQSMADFGTA